MLLATEGDLHFDVAFERELHRRPLDRKDRALALRIAAGTLKLRRRLDFIIDQFLETRHKPLPGPIQQILRLGVFQLTELSRVPGFAAVNSSVELAKQWGHAGTAKLVNAILRRTASADGDWPWPDRKHDCVNHLATVYSYPNWIVRHWAREHGENEAERLCRLGNLSAGLTLRLVGETQWTDTLLRQLEKQAPGSLPGRWFTEYRFIPDPPPAGDLVAVSSGAATVQNESAALSTYLLDLQPGESLLEVGAAPGGKSTHAARFVGPEGLVVAIDINARRMRRLRENLSRTEQSWVRAVRADGRTLPVSQVDKILIDAPCSALGLLHRHPDLRWQKEIVDIARLAELQRELVEAGLDALGPGGRLVYSTCSTTRQENEGLLARVLERRTDVTVVDPRTHLPAGMPANAHWVTIQPDPPQLDGAFACALKKIVPA